MLAIIFIVICSYLSLYLSHERSDVLGLTIQRPSIVYSFIGGSIAIGFVVFTHMAIAYAVKNPYQLNSTYSLKLFFASSWYIFKGVILEELIFRGVFFYLLLKKIGFKKAVWISAIAFGIYHWFSYGILGQPMKMILTMLTTGSVGYVLALTFRYGKTIYLPIAIHFGYNFTNQVVFSATENIGKQLFYKQYSTDLVVPSAWVGLPLLLVHYIGFQLIVYLYAQRLKKQGLNTAST